MTPETDAQSPRCFCLFTGGSRPLGVDLEAVAEVVESARLVRVPLCPRPVLGLLTYRGKVVPVLGLGSADRDRPAADDGAGHAFLVLRTAQGLWGLAIDRGGVLIEHAPEALPFRGDPPPGGFAVAGAVDRGGVSHAILDPGRSWRGVRSEIERWYALAIEDRRPERPAASSRVPL